MTQKYMLKALHITWPENDMIDAKRVNQILIRSSNGIK